MKRAAALLAMVLMMVHSIPAAGSPAIAESWQPFHESPGGTYAFAPAGMVRIGDRVQVRARAVEVLGAGEERVTTILYDLDCRQRRFRMLEVVEEQGGVLSVCKNPSDDFPIRPEKHPHLEKLCASVCP